MATLTGKLVADTYKALLKLIDNDIITYSEKQISDGYGGGTGIFIDQNGFIRASKFIVTGGNSSQFLKGDGSLDLTSYLSVASASSTYLTIANAASTYLPIGSTTSAIAEGSRLYFTEPRVLSTPLTGFVSTSGTVTSSDTVLTSIEKIWWNIVNGGGGGGGGYVPYSGATQNLDLGTYGLISDFLQLNVSNSAVPTTAGTMSWDNTDGTANIRLKGGNVNLHVGQDSIARVVNGVGSNLLRANYQAVKIMGAQGQRLQVSLATANSDPNSKDTIGLVAENINANQEGFVITNGILDEINTSGSLQGETWADGDTLYLNGTTAGAITNVKPQAPIHTVILGFVVYAHAIHGKIFVKVDNGYELDELHNVKIVGPLNKDILVYDSTTTLWNNRRVFKTQGYVPFYDDTLLLDNSPIYTNGNNVGIGTTTITEKLVVNGNILASQFKRVGGLSTQFLKADGSIDSTQYQPYSADLTAIDNLALTTGLLRKVSTDTWELDQTEYISLAYGTSTYQTYANLSSNLTASATKYPSVNAVNTGLGLKLNLTGGTLTGGLTLNYSYPTISLSDVSSGTIWNILNDGATFKLNYGATNKFYMFSNGNAEFANFLTAGKFIKAGGLSTEFLKADGSVDSTNYQPYDQDLTAIGALALTTGLLRKNGTNTWELDQSEYITLAYAGSTYQLISNLSSNLTASSTKYPSVNAVNSGLNLRLALTGGTMTGDLALSYSIPTIQFSDTSSGTIWNVRNNGGGFEINSGITNKFTMLSSGNATFVNDLTANKFIKSGGTSTQFLMADGSVSSGNAGTVTSVGLSAPSGFSVSGSPVTSSGTLALGFAVGYSLPSDATQATWTAKQNALNGTGFVKIVGTTISYDNSTYYLASNPSGYISGITSLMVTNALGYTPYNATNPSGYISGNQTITLSGDVSGSGATAITTTLATITQGATGSFVKITLDTKGRVTGNVAVGSSDITSALGYTPYNSTNPSGYISGITSGMVTTALGYTPVTNARQLTINGTTYDLSADRSWTISGTIGGLTSGYIPKATSASTLGNSLIYDNGSGVGIGTNSPTQLLTVNGEISAVTRYRVNPSTQTNQIIGDGNAFNIGGSNNLGIRNDSGSIVFASGGYTVQLHLNTSGNLGLGVTPSAWGVTGKVFEFGGAGGTASLFDNGINDTWYVSNTYYNAGWKYYSTGTATQYYQGTGKHIWYTAPYGTAGTAISFTQAMTLDASGNLMVGATSPLLTASGRGNITLNGSSSNILAFGIAGAYSGYIYSSSSNLELDAGGARFIQFNTNGNERARITSGGNVLIGTTTDSGYKLDVNGTGRFSGAVLFNSSDVRSQGYRIYKNGSDSVVTSFYQESISGTTYGNNMQMGASGDIQFWNYNGGWNKQLSIGITGAATFSSSVTATQATFTATANTYAGGALILKAFGGTNPIYLTSVSGYFALSNGGGADHLLISSTGAATFSSSVDTNSYIRNTNSGANAAVTIAADGTSHYIQATNAARTVYNNLLLNPYGANVGIGTTSPSGSVRFHIYDSSVNGDVALFESNTTKADIWLKDVNTTIGQVRLRSESNAMVMIAGNTERMRITSGGNVGIGTTAPGNKLEVEGDIAAPYSSSIYLDYFPNRGDYKKGFSGLNQSTGTARGLHIFNYDNDSNQGINFWVGTNTAKVFAARISPAGNVLIGTTTDAGYKLYLNGTLGVDGAATFTGNINVYKSSPNISLSGASGTSAQYNINNSSGTLHWAMYSTIGGAGAQGNWQLYSAGKTGGAGNVIDITPAGACTFSSSITASSFFESSDRTIKTLLVDNYQTKGIESITAKLYTKNGKEELGYFAQDVQGILPSAVTMGTNGLLNLSYREVLVAKVQRTETEIEKLKNRVLELETQLNLR